MNAIPIRAVFSMILVVLLGSLAVGDEVRVFLGTYTQGDSEGIYDCQLDTATGELTNLRLVAECPNPSFVAIHPSQKFLYAVSEVDNFRGESTGGVYAYAITDEGLTELNAKSSSGAAPCHLITDSTGRHVLVANYMSGTAAVLRIQENGSLGNRMGFFKHDGSGPNAQRQEGPHAHSINLDAQNNFAVVADLGIDQVRIYKFDQSTGVIEPNDPAFVQVPAGGGPRHFAFHPSGKFAYTNNEMLSSVTAFRYDGARGSLDTIGTVSTLPGGRAVPGNSTAEVQVHASGKFVYCSNRGHDSIAIFMVNGETGALTHVGNQPTGGRTPRNFGIDPTGQFLLAANQSTDDVVSFRVDGTTGKLTPTGHALNVPSPVCVKFMK